MGFILAFIQKNSKILLAVFLLILSLILTLNRNLYHASAVNSIVLDVRSSLDARITKTSTFFSLNEKNEELIKENRQLKQILFNKKKMSNASIKKLIDTAQYNQQYTLIPTEVIYNSINQQNNFITLNKGRKDGIYADMGIISSNGVIGIVTKSTDNYAAAISILHSKTRINARLKNKEYFGTLIWKAEDSRLLHLIDIPKFVPISVGDSIETDGKSSLFPEGIQIGKIAAYQLDKHSGNWDISVEIFQNMSKVSHVFVVKNLAKNELKLVEPKNTVENTQ